MVKQLANGDHLEKWECELQDSSDVANAGKRFVDLEGLDEQALKHVDSGTTTLMVGGGSVVNGKLKVPKGANLEFGHIEKRGPADKDKNKDKKEKEESGVVVRRLSSALGTRKVLAVRVTAADAAPTSSASEISNYIFGTNGDISNLKETFW